jgi:calcium/calmodulin-dependent protein kinase (CaM kinase) II
MTAPDATTAELLGLTKRLLEAVAAGDWQTYRQLVADDITCFEPEARGQLVSGLPFHEFYFKLPGPAPGASPRPVLNTIAAPVVRLLSDSAAVVAYVRLTQTLDDAGRPVTKPCEETRVWQKQGGAWKHVHFHRSPPG